jgi:iron(III) transport system substrate-binding protein
VNAEKLVKFLTGASAQRQLSEQLYRRPVRLDLPLPPMTPLRPKEQLPLIRQDRALVSKSRQEWVDHFHQLCQKYRQQKEGQGHEN